MTFTFKSEQGGEFTEQQLAHACEQWLEFGEQTYQKSAKHLGYFSGPGWAARVLRAYAWHVENKEKNSA